MVLAQAGACEADSLSIPPHAAAPAGSREPRTAEPRSALTAAYAYGPHLRCTAQAPVRVAQMHRRYAASALPTLWYLLLGMLAVGARGVAEIASSVHAATHGNATTRPPPPKRYALSPHSRVVRALSHVAVCAGRPRL